ncbi:MAG: CoA pyrophosphatase [Bacteroidetes bacterium]|nr:CoA pyrophosphatase [Bacteroidota bacterium]
MNFPAFIDELALRLGQPLPGLESQLRMTSLRRIREMSFNPDLSKARMSGVLILLYPAEQDVMTVFIQRPRYNGVHSGQISFPGGKAEPEDRDIRQTALRESREEVGLDTSGVKVIGNLTELYIPPSRFRVQPVVAYTAEIPSLTGDPVEVDEIIRVSLRELLDPGSFQNKKVTVGDWSNEVPCFYVKEVIIWGATAMILNEFLEIIRVLPSLQ